MHRATNCRACLGGGGGVVSRSTPPGGTRTGHNVVDAGPIAGSAPDWKQSTGVVAGFRRCRFGYYCIQPPSPSVVRPRPSYPVTATLAVVSAPSRCTLTSRFLLSMLPTRPSAVCSSSHAIPLLPTPPTPARLYHNHNHLLLVLHQQQRRAAAAADAATTTPVCARLPCRHSLNRTCSHHHHRRRRYSSSSLACLPPAFAPVHAARMTARRHQPFATDSMPYPCC